MNTQVTVHTIVMHKNILNSKINIRYKRNTAVKSSKATGIFHFVVVNYPQQQVASHSVRPNKLVDWDL